jgi:CO dehydrogenase/acetyl-CoA synthase alpha subunit
MKIKTQRITTEQRDDLTGRPMQITLDVEFEDLKPTQMCFLIDRSQSAGEVATLIAMTVHALKNHDLDETEFAKIRASLQEVNSTTHTRILCPHDPNVCDDCIRQAIRVGRINRGTNNG